MDDVKSTYREGEQTAKETWRKADGDESVADKVGNAGDEVRKDLGNAGDDATSAAGTAGDLAYATGLAAQMVGQAGMAGTLVSFAAARGSALTGGNLVSTVLADRDGREMVEDLLRARREDVRLLLGSRRHLVQALRDALLVRHELIGHEITDALVAAEARGTSGVVPEAVAPASIDLRSSVRREPPVARA
jgi:hypothetical protein